MTICRGTANAVTEGVFYDQVEYSYDPRGNITEKIYSLDGETVDTVNYGYGNQNGVILSEQSESNGSPAQADAVWADVLTSFDGVSISYDQIGNPLNWRDGIV